MIEVNYPLFVQILYGIWCIGGALCLLGTIVEKDYYKKTVNLISAFIMLGVVFVCLIL